MKKILVIGSHKTGNKNSPSLIAESLNSDNTVAKVIYWEDMVFSIKTGSVVVTVDDKNIFDFEPNLVIAVGWYKNGSKSIYRDVAFSLATILNYKDIPYWNSEMGNQRSITKLSCMVQLALSGINVPTTYFCIDNRKPQSLMKFPYIAKAAAASRGDMNFLVSGIEDLAQINDSDSYFIYQEFLKNNHDLRLICFNGKPSLVLKRARVNESTHLNNTSKGAISSWIKLSDISPQLLTICEKICKITGREMAGIDFIPDASSNVGYSCLEVNAVPQLTSGTDSNIKMTALLTAVEFKEI